MSIVLPLSGSIALPQMQHFVLDSLSQSIAKTYLRVEFTASGIFCSVFIFNRPRLHRWIRWQIITDLLEVDARDRAPTCTIFPLLAINYEKFWRHVLVVIGRGGCGADNFLTRTLMLVGQLVRQKWCHVVML